VVEEFVPTLYHPPVARFQNVEKPSHDPMSYGITPIAVRLSQVNQAFGAGDDLLSRLILERFAHRFERDRTDPDDEDEPTLKQALHEIIDGTPLRKNYGHKYAYILEMLCQHYGQFLPNQNFTAMDSDWAETVDLGLTTAGVPEEQLRLNNHLMCRGSPIRIPEPDDFPSIGYLREAEISPALGALETANFSRFDLDVQEAVKEVRGWLEVCSRAGCDLVCFYY
jgi:hypothetical protein